MNELFLYELFRSILAQSKVIQGRFVVAEGYGNDLNSNSFDNVLKDALGQLSAPQKYPAAILMPPVEIVGNWGVGWSRFKMRMFFMATTYHTGMSDIMGIAADTNTSSHPANFIWKDMRQCAGDFRMMFNLLVMRRGLVDKVREAQDNPDVIERYSMMNNDRVSGVCLSFETDLFTGCIMTTPEDYPETAVNDIQIPNPNFHPSHSLS